MSVNGSKVTLDLRNNKDGNLLSDAVLTAANPGTDLELVCGYEYVTAIANPVVITGMHDITLSGYGMAGSLKIEKCNGKVSLTAQHNRAVLGQPEYRQYRWHWRRDDHRQPSVSSLQ